MEDIRALNLKLLEHLLNQVRDQQTTIRPLFIAEQLHEDRCALVCTLDQLLRPLARNNEEYVLLEKLEQYALQRR